MRTAFFMPFPGTFLTGCLFSSLKGRFSCLSKRLCVQFKTHLRFLPADLFKSSKWFSVGFICMGYSLRGPHFKYNNL